MRAGNGLGDVMWPSLIYSCTLVLLWIDIDALRMAQWRPSLTVLVPSLPLLAAPCSSPPTKDTSNQRYIRPKTSPTKETSNQREGGWKSVSCGLPRRQKLYWHTCRWLKSHLLQINKYKKCSITQHLLAHKCGLQISFTGTQYTMQVQVVWSHVLQNSFALHVTFVRQVLKFLVTQLDSLSRHPDR